MRLRNRTRRRRRKRHQVGCGRWRGDRRRRSFRLVALARRRAAAPRLALRAHPNGRSITQTGMATGAFRHGNERAAAHATRERRGSATLRWLHEHRAATRLPPCGASGEAFHGSPFYRARTMGPRSGGHRRHRLGLRGRLACGAVRGFRWPELPFGERALAAHAAFASLRRRSGNRHRLRCSRCAVPAVRMGNGPGKLAARRPRRGGWSPRRLPRSQAHRPHLPRRSVASRRRRNPTPWPPESPAPLRSAQNHRCPHQDARQRPPLRARLGIPNAFSQVAKLQKATRPSCERSRWGTSVIFVPRMPFSEGASGSSATAQAHKPDPGLQRTQSSAVEPANLHRHAPGQIVILSGGGESRRSRRNPRGASLKRLRLAPRGFLRPRFAGPPCARSACSGVRQSAGLPNAPLAQDDNALVCVCQ